MAKDVNKPSFSADQIVPSPVAVNENDQSALHVDLIVKRMNQLAENPEIGVSWRSIKRS